MTKAFLLTLAMVVMLSLPQLCFADLLRMGQLNCTQFRQTNSHYRSEMIAWLYGYWSHENASDIMGDGLRERFAQDLLNTCDKNPDTPLLDALKLIPKR